MRLLSALHEDKLLEDQAEAHEKDLELLADLETEVQVQLVDQ